VSVTESRSWFRRIARGAPFLITFGLASLGIGLARGVTTTYVPVLLDDSGASPGLIGVLMMVNPVAGFTMPLVVGYLGDRSPRQRPWPAFLGAGAVIASAALVSVGILSAGSVPLLAVSALGVYVGVATAAMAHRSMILARFSDAERPAATSSQEGQKIAGGLLGLLAGGALISVAPALPFLLAAAVVAVLAVPTITVMRRRKGPERPADTASSAPHANAGVTTLLHVLRLPGARLVLLAQILWVTAYVALPTFFIVAMREEFDTAPFESALGIAALGLLSGGALLAAGRTPPRHVSRLLMLGAVLLGTGLPVAALIPDFGWALVPLGAAGIGFGLLTALGLPFFSSFIPEEESGRCSGAYFAGRAVAAALSLPLAGLLITVTGSYRAILAQGVIALAAVAPIALARRRDARRDGRRRLRSDIAGGRCRVARLERPSSNTR
jgi:MFS family permease